MPKATLRSPWIEGIARTRDTVPLAGDTRTDVVVVGAGIAGIATTYFLLRRTTLRVLLLEGDRVAHGATGHNAGQLVSYFERGFASIAHEFGLALAADGQRAVESAWGLLDDMRQDLQLQTPCLTFDGFAGCPDVEELLVHLKNNAARKEAGLACETIVVAEDVAKKERALRPYRAFFTLVSREYIADRLETKNTKYIAIVSSKKGVMNSARFCEEVVSTLLATYSDRLTVAEHTPVHTVALASGHATLHTPHGAVLANKVVLCTNGFEKIQITNVGGADIDVKFHHLVRGIVGYMSAFTEDPFAAPAAISYLPSGKTSAAGAFEADPYFYFTRRPHAGSPQGSNLVCIAGPEAAMDDTTGYSRAHPYPQEAKKALTDFMRKNYRHAGRRLSFTYFWHGLMGYTPNGIRCVGAEPCNPVLLYNLGCNGVGILPSLYGGYRISQVIRGEKLAPSIFDPQDQRCYVPQAQKPFVPAYASEKWVRKEPVLAFVAFWVVAVVIVIGSYFLRAA